MRKVGALLLGVALLASAACKSRSDGSVVRGSIKAGEDSNTVYALREIQSYAKRYENAHQAWAKFFAERFDRKKRSFSESTAMVSTYIMDQSAANARFEGQIQAALRDGGYSDAVDVELRAALQALEDVRAALANHPVYKKEYSQTDVSKSSESMLPRLQALHERATRGLVAAVSFERQKIEDDRTRVAAELEKRIAEIQQTIDLATAASMDHCSKFVFEGVEKKSLAEYQQAKEPMQFWMQASDPTVWHNLPDKEQLAQVMQRDEAGMATFDPSQVYRLLGDSSLALQQLLSYDAGVSEGYTVGQHTLMVLELLSHQLKHAQLTDGGDTDYAVLMAATLFFHDIGKGVPVVVWRDKTYQHEFTVPVLENMMCQMGFTRREVTIASRIVSHDLFGETAKASGRGDAPSALHSAEHFARVSKDIAAELKLPAADIFELQHTLYLCDAGAYRYVRERFMCETDRGLEMKVGDLRRLRDELRGEQALPAAAYAISNCRTPNIRLTGER